MCAPDPPPPPDYAGAARAQGENNLQAAIASSVLSNPNIVNPYGSRTVTYDQPAGAYQPAQQAQPNQTTPQRGAYISGWDNPALYGGPPYQQVTPSSASSPSKFSSNGLNVPVPTITETLSPVQQGLFDTENRIKQNLLDTGEAGLGRVSKAMDTPFDMSQVQQYSVDPGVVSYDDPVVQALIERNQGPMQQRRQQTESDLLARGFNPGGEGYDARVDDLNRLENDYRLAALLAGGQEQSRVAGLESSRRGQDIQEQAYLRGLPLNELNALRTGNQAGIPQFQAYQGSQVAPAPLFDATLAQGNFAQQNYQNKAAAGGGLFDLLGAGLGAAGAAGGFPTLFGFG